MNSTYPAVDLPRHTGQHRLSGSIFWTLALGYVTYLISLVVYRVFFHPLAKFPGPRYAGMTRWHEFYFDVVKKGQFSFVIEEWHRKYGPIIRIVPDEIHIQDPQFYDTIYTKAGRVDKYELMSAKFGSDKSAFSTAAADLHAVRRGALNPMFSRAKILELENVVRDKAGVLVKQIRMYQKQGKPFKISRAFMAYAGDVILRYSFGTDYDHLSSEGFKDTLHDPFAAIVTTSPLAFQFPIVPKILNALPEAWVEKIEPLFAMQFKVRRDLENQVKAVIEERKDESKANASTTTVFHTMLSDPDLPVAQKAILRLSDEAHIVVAAGVTTTGWALSVGAFHIINNPDIYARLRRELEEAIPNPAQFPSWMELEKLPYLTGCVRESIRLSYPVSARSPRLLPKPVTYRDWVIPAKTPISMHITDISNDESIFPEHERFKPERWINPPKTSDGSSLDRYFVCFHKGTRSCLGINLAYCEMYLAMAAVYRNFHLQLYETDVSDVTMAHDYFIPLPRTDSQGVRVKCLPDP